MLEKTEKEEKGFTQLGKKFQEKVMQALMDDKQWATSFIEVFDVDECFDYVPLKIMAKTYIQYFKKYKDFPTFDLFETIIKDEYSNANDTVLRERMLFILNSIKKREDLSDLPWVKEKAFTFCKQQMLKKALLKGSELIMTDKYESVVELMKNAIAAGMTTNVGHEYNEDIDARYSMTYRNPIPTGIPQLDEKKIMNGGLGNGELGIVVAPTGVGKSHCLVEFGCGALLVRKNVFYYSMELKERLIGIRFDSRLTGIPSTDCPEHKEEIRAYLEENKEKIGKLIIKEFPTRKITVNTIRSHVEKMSLKGVKPDMIIIDYAGIIRSTEKYDLPRLEMQAVIQEIRNLAQELNVPIWTALQSNKEGAKAEIVDTTNMAESYGQASEADFVLGLQRQSAIKSTGYGTLFVAKSRLGIDGVQFNIHLDTSRSKLTIINNPDENSEMSLEDAQQLAKTEVLNSFKKSISKRKNLFSKINGVENI
jgi:hypothetical protein